MNAVLNAALLCLLTFHHTDGQTNYTCSFNSGLSLCNLIQDTADQTDWKIGHLGDIHTSGNYAYLALSTMAGSSARMMTSRSISTQGRAYTVSFMYYVDADASDTINILIKSASGTYGRLSIKGNKGGYPWRRAQVQLHEMEPFQLILEAQTGPTYSHKGILAIDDLSARLGPATTGEGEVDEILVRLVDGPTDQEGIVQVLHNNVWGTICRDGWSAHEARVICHMLNMRGGRTLFLPDYSTNTWTEQTPIHLDEVMCPKSTGSDITSLAYCHHRGWGNTDCTSRDYATVRCNDEEVDSNMLGHRLRLGGGWKSSGGQTFIGRVEVNRRGIWGTLCDNQLDDAAARVICRMYGASRGQVYRYPTGPPGPSQKFLPVGRCSGAEGSLFDCILDFSEQTTCPPGGADAWVQCQFPESGKLPVECDFSQPGNQDVADQCGFHGDTGSLNPWQFDAGRHLSPYEKYGGQVGVTMHVDTYAWEDGFSRVVSPLLGHGVGPKEICVAFIYLKTDRNTGNLTVSQKIRGKSTPVYWNEADSGYNVWQEVVLSLYAHSLELVMEVSVGPQKYGSILVDHFRAFQGSCDQHWDKWVSRGGTTTTISVTTTIRPTQRPATVRPSTRRPTTRRPTTSPPLRTEAPPTVGGFIMLCDFNEDECPEHLEHISQGTTATWTRHKGKTPSSATGPDTDFDLGTDQGYYMYLEATDLSPGSRAKMRTTGLVATAGPQCLTLGYNMYGHDIGTFSIYTTDEAGNYNTNNVLFRKKGNQGNGWELTLVDVPSTEAGRRLVFEAERGPNYASDIAFDWPILTDGTCCTEDEWMHCTFDLGMCCYHQDFSADFDWSLNSGPTASYQTGPTTDHTTGTSEGGYVYIEASYPAATHVAKLQSPVATPGSYCITFWYHMYGRDIGVLTVSAGDNSITPWTRSGDQGNMWHQGEVYLPRGATYIEFQAQVVGGVEADISIDDVTWERRSSC